MSLTSIRIASAVAATLCLVAALAAGPASAEDASYQLTIAEGKFQPAQLEVKAGVTFKLSVTNAQKKAAEFESRQLKREKVIPAGATGVVNIGPLEPGTYAFFDDFNPSNKGQIIAK